MSPPNIRIDFQDNDLRDRVRRFIMSRGMASFREIKVDVKDGHVTLRGNVDTFYEKQIALTACKHVAGVLTISDEITVRTQRSATLPVKPR